eukprot:CAMPEP_0114578526 /NCGR_PEP_ID=MMETSP0125-20121206/3052_1 /TAXON_ID=485358 ORGANISM="Aristerostoma sp., Strain ATCC 50986" /NCGR_SAMPLE_ID=MMETSP0125 /ASSEMBLY_ACC=CAM_ASM_000245 /LENGTH=92 /DNA_ID=CAMNT_0001768657 /DNA_START=340 /DNA_END=618 /DNA_ORIENTATION=-
MMVGRCSEEGVEYLDGVVEYDRNVVIESTLAAGSYLVTIDMQWVDNPSEKDEAKRHWRKANLSAYSEKVVNFEEIHEPDFHKIERNLFMSYI